MQESFLHFLWRFQYFNSDALRTTEGECIQVYHPGYPHTDAGPDFRNARLRIGSTDWVGNVEIHQQASDWYLHTHQDNAAYNNVILHVVWTSDRPVYRPDGSPLPTLVLEGKAQKHLLSRYQNLLSNQHPIPCAGSFGTVRTLEKRSALDQALLRRLQHKADAVEALVEANRQDWEESTYQLLAQHFGFRINNEAFLRLSQSLPLKILGRHRDHLHQLEALLFGQAGLLPASSSQPYPQQLVREYAFLSRKYDLTERQMSPHEWLLLRLRPANFPTVRLAQLAKLLSVESGLFALLTSRTVKEVKQRLSVRQSEYWQTHYTWEKASPGSVPSLGKDATEGIIINVAIPLLVAYARHSANEEYLERALQWLEQLPAERNQITSRWMELGLEIRNAADSQACIQLYNHFCTQKQCLQCSIGISLLK